jgi:hypothetical protein
MAGLTMKDLTGALPLALGISVLALLSACDNGPSAVSKQAAGSQMATTGAPERSYNSDRGGNDNAPRVDHRKDEVAKADDGKPMWAPSKRFSAEEGAQRQFERDGEAFGAKSVDQYVKKAHAFVGHPPKGTLTLTRKNGDILFGVEQGGRAAHHVQAGRGHGLLGEAEGPRGPQPAGAFRPQVPLRRRRGIGLADALSNASTGHPGRPRRPRGRRLRTRAAPSPDLASPALRRARPLAGSRPSGRCCAARWRPRRRSA